MKRAINKWCMISC